MSKLKHTLSLSQLQLKPSTLKPKTKEASFPTGQSACSQPRHWELLAAQLEALKATGFSDQRV